MPKGKAVDIRQRELIVQLKDFFDQERRQGSLVSTKDAVGRVANALGIGKRTVKEILSSHRKNGRVTEPDLQSKGKPPYRIQPALETVIRKRIRELNSQGSHVSVRTLFHWLAENYESVPPATLGRALQRMGLIYGPSRNTSALRERDDVLIGRREYLRQKLANRKLVRGKAVGTIRPEVYLDESFVNVNHSVSRTWYFAEEGPWVRKPSGKGPRLILVHAMTRDGLVEGAKLVFQAKRRTGDYHGQMNFENFCKWFTESLLPNIPASSLIVMDNAPYHNVYVDGMFYPTTSVKKADLASWLQEHHPESFEESMIKAELLAECRRLCPKPDYELDRMAESQGHQILRTPQYHPELQPIEQCWAVVKNHCAKKCDYTIAGLRKHVEQGFEKITRATCRAIVSDMQREEDRYWQEDMEYDEQ